MTFRSTCGAQDCEDGRYQHVHLIAHLHAWKMEEQSEYSQWCRCHLKMKPDGTSLKNSSYRRRDVRCVGNREYVHTRKQNSIPQRYSSLCSIARKYVLLSLDDPIILPPMYPKTCTIGTCSFFTARAPHPHARSLFLILYKGRRCKKQKVAKGRPKHPSRSALCSLVNRLAGIPPSKEEN
jgi:hypothetical protein